MRSSSIVFAMLDESAISSAQRCRCDANKWKSPHGSIDVTSWPSRASGKQPNTWTSFCPELQVTHHVVYWPSGLGSSGSKALIISLVAYGRSTLRGWTEYPKQHAPADTIMSTPRDRLGGPSWELPLVADAGGVVKPVSGSCYAGRGFRCRRTPLQIGLAGLSSRAGPSSTE
ncbi:hypothetical protein F4813DRAFT_362592 [Daldinia decipiens]|uniref:uncharacterized protein n=1 Tax=Daldinia decipiens TaxID=326647 RepID=UPI0020C27499|nr:uncharacterized protein F4813DRAFT_362592 [Daldinia decipiens]KAI1656629.1 hypothetical protein F4813DRAFT_362592 [Daldinia decipiens]